MPEAQTVIAFVKIKSHLTPDEIADKITEALEDEFLEIQVEGFMDFGDKD